MVLTLPRFRKYVGGSIIIHFAAFLLIVVSHKFNFTQPRAKVVWIELPKGASETVDIKIRESENLPKTTIQEQKELPAEADVKAKDKEDLQAQPEATQKKLRPIQTEKIPKNMKRAKPKPKQADWQKALAALDKKKRGAPPEAAQIKDKGEGFKYGTGSQPLLVPPDDPEKVAYVAKVRYKILQEWIVPPAYLQGTHPPKATLVVYITKEGTVTSMEWQNTSGNAAFDSSCSRAVSRASPLPIPPQRLEWEAFNEGYEIACDPSLKSKL